MDVTDKLELYVKSNIFDRPRKLIVSPEFIEFDDANWIDSSIARFEKGEVTGLRFGVNFISGYKFTIGRTFCIDIKGLNERIIKIRLTSLYGIKKKVLHEKFCQIVNAFMNSHQLNLANHLLETFNEGNEVNVLGTTFKDTGVIVNGKEITWDDLGTKDYTSYYALFSKKAPTIHKSYNYLKDWNTSLIYNLSKQILSDKGYI